MINDSSNNMANDIAALSSGATAEPAPNDLLLAALSHEIRAPLNAILGFSNLLRHADNLSAHQRQALLTIQRSGEHLLQLINDILAMNRLKTKQLPLTVAPFDLSSLLQELALTYGLFAEQKGLLFELNVDPELPPTVYGDAVRLRQVLFNLLCNAVKFTDRGGVQLRVESLGRVVEGVRLRFSVSDTGPGVELGDHEKIFNRFGQGELGRRSHDGHGLGLNISRECVRLMGGELILDSGAGEGARFLFELTLALAKQEARPPSAISPLPAADPLAKRLAQLPKRQRVALAAAVNDLEVEQIQQVVDAIRPQDRSLALQLDDLVHHFRYDELLDALSVGANELNA